MPAVILHIDDQPRLPKGLADVLQREGYALLQTADPEEAMRRVSDGQLALVLMEIELAGCDGLDLMAGIRDPRHGSVPVLVLTRAARNSGLHGEAIAIGCVDFLTKPTRAAELLARIHEVVPPASARPQRRKPRERTSNDLSGSIGDTPVPELLARLRRRGASGALALRRGEAGVGVQLRNGSPYAVTRSGTRRAEDLLIETFGWSDGRYRFSEQRRLASDVLIEITQEPSRLLLAGVLEASPRAQVLEILFKRASLYVMAQEGAGNGVELTAEQARVLEGLGGDETLEELLESDIFEPRLLYGLWVAGRLELQTAPVLSLTDLYEVEGEEEEEQLEPVAPRRAPTADVHCAQVAPAPKPDRDALRGSLRALAQQVSGRDDFEALGVSVDASESEISAAYEHILAQLPDEDLLANDFELRERAARIHRRVDAAHAHLKDPETRRAYTLLHRESEADRSAKPSAERALEAERWFRKGKGHLDGRRYADAAESFGMATHLDPQQGDYVAHLGYALYLSNPDDTVVRREAMEHVANGIKRSPTSQLSYVFLGRILKAKGDLKAAMKLFRKALAIQPDFHAALQELRLLEMRREKGAGLLSRLLRR